jgi:hypothetical protein
MFALDVCLDVRVRRVVAVIEKFFWRGGIEYYLAAAIKKKPLREGPRGLLL